MRQQHIIQKIYTCHNINTANQTHCNWNHRSQSIMYHGNKWHDVELHRRQTVFPTKGDQWDKILDGKIDRQSVFHMDSWSQLQDMIFAITTTVPIAKNPYLTPATLQTTTLLKTTASYDGKRFVSSFGQPEYTVKKLVIPPFYELDKHTHPMPIFGFVLDGEIILVNNETGKRQIFRAGAVIAELQNTVHYGYTENKSCTLLVFFAGVVGQPLSEPYNEGDKGTKAQCQHCFISESEITSIIDSCDIDTIVAAFKEQSIALGGRTIEEVKREFAVVTELIRSDLSARLQRDSSVSNDVGLVLRDNAFRALLLHRISHALWSPRYIQYSNSETRIARYFAFELHNFAKRYSIDIHPGATIGRGLYLDHGIGTRILNGAVIGENCGILHCVYIGDCYPTVIGEQATVGNDCTIGAGVLLGAYIKPNPLVQETERERGRRHPVIGDHCFLSPGVKVVGPVIVANGSFIPMGTLVKSDYPTPQIES